MKKLRDIMTTQVETAEPDSTVEEVAIMMRDEDVGAIPVLDEEELIGIVTDRDIVVRCIAEGKDPAQTTAEELIGESLVTAEPGMDVPQAARLMADRQVRRLPVVEKGKLVGIVSLGDIAVKEDGEVSGEALEEISRGVKESRGGKQASSGKSGRRQQGIAAEEDSRARAVGSEDGRRGRTQQVSARGRQAGSARGREQAGGAQGIANRGAQRESERQKKVSASRAQATRTSQRRRAS